MDMVCGVLGLASAMVVPPAIGILGAAYSAPSRHKNWAFACFSAGNPLDFAVGGLVCGVTARVFNWRAGFIPLAIIWAVFAVSSFWIVPSVEAFEPAPLKTRLRIALERFDALRDGADRTRRGNAHCRLDVQSPLSQPPLEHVADSSDSVRQMVGSQPMSWP